MKAESASAMLINQRPAVRTRSVAEMDMAPTSKRMKTEARPQLPEEIVEDILARLPTKALSRFLCVSRSWHDLLTSPAFEGLHLQLHQRTKRRLFLKPSGNSTLPFYAWTPTTGVPAVERLAAASCFPYTATVYPVTKSCNGLVLLRCLQYDTYHVWNPSANEMVALPDRTPLRVSRGFRPHATVADTSAIYGLAHCPATEQYRAVRLYNPNGDEATVCEVFTLDESTHWRPAATPPPARRIRIDGRQGAALCNGNLHFVQRRGDITAFRLSDETFGLLAPPAELRADPTFLLTELGGCLCAYYTGNRGMDGGDPYHVWLLTDYDAGEWEKVRCIDWASSESAPLLKSEWIAPLGMYDDAKKIMFGTGTCQVFVVDPGTGAPEVIFSPDGTAVGKCYDGGYPTMGLFEESLVSVGRSSEEIIFSSPVAQAVSDILTWLPARAVARLNQVCKGWRAMIKTDGFVLDHMRHRANLNKSPRTRIMFTDGIARGIGLRTLEEFISTPSLIPPLIDGSSRGVCSKPCHGLNALSFPGYDLVCNPSTGYSKHLPLVDGARRNGDDDALLMARFGLGYEPSMKHVLVRMAYKEWNLATREYSLDCKVRVLTERYSFEVEPPPRPVADVPPAHVDGKLYWLADPALGPPRSTTACEVIIFNIISTEFQILQGPPCSHGRGRMSIVELQGELCVACSRRSTNAIEIWAMDGSGSWSMRHCVQLARFSPEYSSEEVTLLAIDPKDRRILLSTGRALGYYDPKTLGLETIYRLGADMQGKKFVPLLFMESLVHPCDAKYDDN